ncbi:FAD-dependent oxidoreductase [Thraustotheca clavata]|uniref:FAD-dependent oxidoreductase n=1 Tax=Thraustotheca clavata TaxID=74557 RepID=A0A1W0AAR2_9STRA|nr:FAD-dependent oxidoreductase [Thraustotheca clavata]
MYDVAIVGGGVVGTAVFRELVLRGYNVVLLEKNEFLVQEASSGNSGIACTGYDAPKGSLEVIRMKKVYKRCIVATMYSTRNTIECSSLNHELGDYDVKVIDASDLYVMEPALAPGARGAVFVPGEVVVEPWLIPIAYAHHGLVNGGTILTSHGVVSGEIQCSKGKVVEAKAVVNCAGNFGDLVEAIHKPNNVPFKITPRKGQFVVFGGDAAPVVNHVIQPVPTHRTKGVFIFKTLYNQIIVGPTAEDQQEREHPTTDPNVLAKLHDFGCKIFPNLSSSKIVGSYAGLRPATQFRDYQFNIDNSKHWITVAGIRSTGVTASLGIAEYVAETLLSQIHGLRPVKKAIKQYKLPPVNEMAMAMDPKSLLTPNTHGSLHVDHAITRFGWLAMQSKNNTESRL